MDGSDEGDRIFLEVHRSLWIEDDVKETRTSFERLPVWTGAREQILGSLRRVRVGPVLPHGAGLRPGAPDRNTEDRSRSRK